MSINWLITTESPPGIPVPTYGQYGGPNYSGGETIENGETPDFTVVPEDLLDQQFQRHDQVYYNPSATAFDRAQADIQLIQGIRALPEDAVTGEGDLYAGGGILAMLYQIAVVNHHPELLAQLDLGNVVDDAFSLIGQGSIEPAPLEVAGLLDWLANADAAIASIDNPIVADAAGRILDFVQDQVASNALADAPSFQISGGNGFNFPIEEANVSGDALRQSAEPVAAVADNVSVEDLRDLLDLWGGDAVADLVADAVPDQHAASVDALASKLAHLQSDFIL
jgi:hypothetical protein